MLTFIHKLLVVNALTLSLLLLQMPVYGSALDDAMSAGQKLAGLTQEAQTSEVTASVIAEIASQLKNYDHKTDDIVLATAGGGGYLFSLTSSLKKEEEIDSLLEQFAGAAGDQLDTTDTLAYIDAQIESMEKSVAVLFDKYSKQSAQATSFYYAAVAADKSIKGEQESFKKCQEILQKVYEKKEVCKQGTDAAEKAYKTFESLIKKREETNPSLEGKQASKSEMEKSKNAVKAVSPAFEKDATDYEQKAEAANAREDYAAAAEYNQKAAECKKVEKPEQTCDELYTAIEKNEAAGTPPGSMANPLASLSDLTASYKDTYSSLMSENGPLFDKLMLTPFKRALIWRILADLSNEAAISTSDVIYQIQLNITKAEAVRESMPQVSIPKNFKYVLKFEYVLDFLVSSAMAEVKNTGTGRKNAVPAKMPCLGSPGNSNCVKLTSILANTPGFRKMSPNMKQTALKIAKYGDDTNSSPNGLTPGAQANLDFLAKGRPYMKGYLKNSEKVESRKARASGLSSINYEALKASIMYQFNAVTARVLKKKGMSPARYLASRGLPTATNKMSSSFAEVKQTISKTVEKVEKIGLSTVVAPAQAQTQMEAAPEPARNYKMGPVDINTNANDSIFERISIRYFKSFMKNLDSSVEGNK
ncbi:MAG: hypothetical protein WC635_01285 [Bacteriovorax sp.]|jgi:hypothetical protein